MTAPHALPPRTLIDDLLAEQQRLTAVERFSRCHDRGAMPAQARYYRDLIPQSAPAPGQQYAFAVDLDACTGCKACVSACHSLNGLDEEETWRSVGLIHGESNNAPYQQTVTTACHHCVEPGCLEGCPVMAYEKEESTGVVKHLDDQCIGCQYCILKCPYDVPKYSERLGIVRKCDMCIDRLAVGEAPACVQACPTSAIRIELVDKAEVSRAAAPGTEIVPGAFESSYTKPTTVYRSDRSIPKDAKPADSRDLRLEHAHWPLVFMLLLTQMAAGVFGAVGVNALLQGNIAIDRLLATTGFVILQIGLGVSVLHLGRPLGAWRFFLGLRTSWMSREILAFGVLAGTAALCTAATWLPLLNEFLPFIASLTAAVGFAAVFTSVMIYVDTRRPFWAMRRTATKFFGSTLLLGATASAAALAIANESAAVAAATVAIIVQAAIYIRETSDHRRLLNAADDPAHRSALTQARLLPWVPRLQAALFAVSTIGGLLAMTHVSQLAPAFASLALLSTFTSQVIERFTFFTVVIAPRMPGGVAS